MRQLFKMKKLIINKNKKSQMNISHQKKNSKNLKNKKEKLKTRFQEIGIRKIKNNKNNNQMTQKYKWLT